MAANPVRLLSVAEFLEAYGKDPSAKYELHHGQPFRVTFPVAGLSEVRCRLLGQIRPFAESGRLMAEFAFRAVEEYDLRAAGIGYVSSERWAATDLDGYLAGAPELVIELLSASDRAQEMLDREAICLENGCKEFWIVDSSAKRVRVSKPDSQTVTYRSGQQIPLSLFGNASIQVDEIFA